MAESIRTWLITGVSSGFGRSLAEAVLARGERVIGTFRQPSQVAQFFAMAPGRSIGILLDVTDKQTIAREISAAVECLGGVDVVVNNAGYGIAGAVEELSDHEARHVMEANFFGTLEIIRATLPFMRAQGGGHIINFSWTAGIKGIPGMALYNASKFAVEGLSEGLAAEVKHLGIRVTIVAPGSFRTSFAGRSIVKARQQIDAYAASSGKIRNSLDTLDGHQPGDPAKAAMAIIAAVDSPEPPLRLALGADSVATVRRKLDALNKDLTAWEAVSINTAFG